MHLIKQSETSNVLPMQEEPGAATLTTKQLASSVTDERTNQRQES